MKPPLVSIITVTYNAEQFLERTIKNIIEQNYKNIEYIIIDGNSTDGTIDIIKKYEKYISYWISEPDNGLYDAMNKGIDIATGSWINFMNAGDMFSETNTISNVSKNFNEDYQIICGDILRGENYSVYQKTLGLDYAYDSVFVNHQASFTEMSLMKKFMFDSSMKISSDYGFFFRCFIEGCKFKFINMPIAKCLEGGISQQNNVLAWAEAMHLQAKYLKDPMDIFSNKFYKNLISTPNNNQLLIKFLNNLNVQLSNTLQNKRFVLYGFGNIGQIIYHKYKKNIVCIVDKNYKVLKE
ncbi:MAG: glycosyltransferase [Arcobacter sp.]|nr:MAG: glycosyltransferase [Arcobacter sp.]